MQVKFYQIIKTSKVCIIYIGIIYTQKRNQINSLTVYVSTELLVFMFCLLYHYKNNIQTVRKPSRPYYDRHTSIFNKSEVWENSLIHVCYIIYVLTVTLSLLKYNWSSDFFLSVLNLIFDTDIQISTYSFYQITLFFSFCKKKII